MNIEKAMSQNMVGQYVDDMLDSGVPAYEDQVRFPDIATYDPLARLAWLEEEDEQYRADNEIYHELMNHAQDCKQSHYYITRDGRKSCCDKCKKLINRLYGMHRYYQANKEAA